MKTKNILHLVAFVLTFAVSVSVAGVVKSFQGLSTAEKITKVLTQDINNGFSRRTNCSNSRYDLAQKTDDYVSASESLEVNDLPKDFQIAWQKHMQAWRNHSNFLMKIKYSNENREIDLDFIDSKNTNEINRTWWEVLRIAKRNGAVIPANAYQ